MFNFQNTPDSDTDSTTSVNVRGKKAPKSSAVFFSQIIIIYIVVITSIVNLSIQDCTKPGVCNLWIAMLSSALGYLLPSPSLRITSQKAIGPIGIDATDSTPHARDTAGLKDNLRNTSDNTGDCASMSDDISSLKNTV